MIVSHQMKHSMQCQYLDFLSGRMTQLAGILPRNVGRDSDVAGQTVHKPTPGGNESTSVGWSFAAKRRFSERNSELPVTNTLTVPLSLLARQARATNWASAVSLNPTTGLRKITNVFLCSVLAC